MKDQAWRRLLDMMREGMVVPVEMRYGDIGRANVRRAAVLALAVLAALALTAARALELVDHLREVLHGVGVVARVDLHEGRVRAVEGAGGERPAHGPLQPVKASTTYWPPGTN